MAPRTRVAKQRGRPVRLARAGYDAAKTTDNNRRHWANTDSLSPDAANSAFVRATLRNRARYEVANNSYAKGIITTLANDIIGTGPRLQLLTENDGLNRRIEADFSAWCQLVGLAEKLRTLRQARAQDGEAFAVLATNDNLDFPVKLDLKLIEADQVMSPFGLMPTDSEIDGIKVDSFGCPVSYRVLTCHPGDMAGFSEDDYVHIPAASMLHLFRVDRPGQHRGVTEIAPALPLFAQLRRYTLAVISAAEAAADFSGILYTDASADGADDTGESDEPMPMDLFALERNMLLTMPGGWKMSQVKAEQPTTTYGGFKKEILNEIARCLSMPFNVAAGNSSGYNYASGRLDHQTYFKSIRVDQHYIATKALDRILNAWLVEYQLGAGVTTGSLGIKGLIPHQWFWDGMEHVDPAKEAKAQQTRLGNNTTTLAHEFARQGKDWETELRQRARELKLLRELGMAKDPTKKPDKEPKNA